MTRFERRKQAGQCQQCPAKAAPRKVNCTPCEKRAIERARKWRQKKLDDVDGDACSAAYWIASAADQIVANATAVVGSIGVVSSLLDTKKADEMNGIRELTGFSVTRQLRLVGIKEDVAS